MNDPLHIVWFKRDLRLEDHEALSQAVAQGPSLALVIIETSLWRASRLAAQHYHFALECYEDLHHQLASRGLGLTLIICQQATEAFAWLHKHLGQFNIYSHMETGDEATYARDRAMLSWCRQHDLIWKQYRQFGVVRGLKERKAWVKQWESLMRQPRFGFERHKVYLSMAKGRKWLLAALETSSVQGLTQQAPDREATGTEAVLINLCERTLSIAPDFRALNFPEHQTLGLSALLPPNRQHGGIRQANEHLESFLTRRSAQYRGGISSPLRAPQACSRLSVYLSYGCLSLREVVQRTREQLHMLEDPASRQAKGLAGFLSSLHWHCHFVQKLETEPAIEWQNMHRGYDGLRESDFAIERFEALKAAKTGWPMVDACVRMLEDCGWLNFRMRAMIVSVAAYPLWLHWREVGFWLARHFLDYEAGIHWSQMQMQSGTTGINTTRVYNPIKQAMEHDPEGLFVRRWLPGLRALPDHFLFEPWHAPSDLRLAASEEIRLPIVDLAQATRQAKAKLHQRRAQAEVVAETQSVIRRHASSKRPQERYLPKVAQNTDDRAAEKKQLSFDFE